MSIDINTLTEEQIRELIKITGDKVKDLTVQGTVTVSDECMSWLGWEERNEARKLPMTDRDVTYHRIHYQDSYKRTREVAVILNDSPVVEKYLKASGRAIAEKIHGNRYGSTDHVRVGSILREARRGLPFYVALCKQAEVEHPGIFDGIVVEQLNTAAQKTKVKSGKLKATAKKNRSQKFLLRDQEAIAGTVKRFLYERMDSYLIRLLQEQISAKNVDNTGESLRTALQKSIASLTTITEEELLKYLVEKGGADCRRLLAVHESKYLVAGLIDKDELVRLAAEVRRVKQKEEKAAAAPEVKTAAELEQIV